MQLSLTVEHWLNSSFIMYKHIDLTIYEFFIADFELRERMNALSIISQLIHWK